MQPVRLIVAHSHRTLLRRAIVSARKAERQRRSTSLYDLPIPVQFQYLRVSLEILQQTIIKPSRRRLNISTVCEHCKNLYKFSKHSSSMGAINMSAIRVLYEETYSSLCTPTVRVDPIRPVLILSYPPPCSFDL